MIRVQLASNYQVVELTFENWKEVDVIQINEAVKLVNKLGKEVENTPSGRTAAKKPEENKPSEAQIAYAISLGVSERAARAMTAKGLHKAIEDAKKYAE